MATAIVKLDALAYTIGTAAQTFPELRQGVSDNPFQVLGLQRNDLEGDVDLFADSADVAQVFLPWTVARIERLLFQPDLEVVGRQVGGPLLLQGLPRVGYHRIPAHTLRSIGRGSVISCT